MLLFLYSQFCFLILRKNQVHFEFIISNSLKTAFTVADTSLWRIFQRKWLLMIYDYNFLYNITHEINIFKLPKREKMIKLTKHTCSSNESFQDNKSKSDDRRSSALFTQATFSKSQYARLAVSSSYKAAIIVERFII